MECKRALEQVEGDIARAVDLLKQQGLAKADKKTGRAASQGLIEPYIHGAGRIGSIVEVNCETDFVARTPEFRELAHDHCHASRGDLAKLRLNRRSALRGMG